MKQILNKLLFVFAFAILWNLIPAVASADSFIQGGAVISLNIDGSDPSAVKISADVEGGQYDPNLLVDASFYDNGGGYITKHIISGNNVSFPFYGHGEQIVNLTGQTEGTHYMQFTGSINLSSINYTLYYYLGHLVNTTIVTVSSDPTSPIIYGTGTTIKWTAGGAAYYCLENKGRGGAGTSGEFYVPNLTSATSYSVSCYDSNTLLVGFGELTVDVLAPVIPTVTVTANGTNPTVIPFEGGVTVNWITSNASSCTCTYSPIPPNLSPDYDGNCGTGEGNTQNGRDATNVPPALDATTTFNVVCKP